MLNKSLIRALNSGSAVAFVGSGVSVDAGLPAWASLYEKTRSALLAAGKQIGRAERWYSRGDLPEAFGELKRAASASDVDKIVVDILSAFTQPSTLHFTLADWPFGYYVTTNYDHLLEHALRKLGPEHGPWLPVGNTAGEIRKLSGSPEKLIWHPHGSIKLYPEKCRLVLGAEDYAELYPDSPTSTTIHAVAQLSQLVVIGFGFSDPDLTRILTQVARFSTSERPVFAFLGQEVRGEAAQAERDDYRDVYNVEVIPYRKVGSDHSDLRRVLQAYSPFVVRRTIAFGREPGQSPEYESYATSVEVHNRICEHQHFSREDDISLRLARAWILSTLQTSQTLQRSELNSGLSQTGVVDESLDLAIANLASEGLLSVSRDSISLTPSGEELCTEAHSAAEAERDKFIASLSSRAEATRNDFDSDSIARVASVAGRFFEDISRERGLGIAQNLVAPDLHGTNYRATALIAGLPKYFEGCADRDEAFRLIEVVVGVLESPNLSEAGYLGGLSQAYFGRHLLRCAPQTREIQNQILQNCCFLLDSSLMLPILARGCRGHAFGVRLIGLLSATGSILVTTDYFVEEVREHAQWAAGLIAKYGEDSPELIGASAGARGYRSNLFIEGFLFSEGSHFTDYLDSIFPERNRTRLSARDVSSALKRIGIQATRPDDWDGFEDSFYADRDEARNQIEIRRSQAGTYKHDRQVQTEADAAVLVSRIRQGKFQLDSRAANYALLVSHTRVIDGLDDLPRRIVVLPEGLLQCLMAAQPMSKAEAEALFRQLLWDLSQSQTQFISEEQILRKFGAIIQISRTDGARLIENYREIMIERFGPDPARAFADTDHADLPFLVRGASRMAIESMQKTVAKEKSRAVKALKDAELSQAERQELERLRREKNQRHEKAKSRQRAAKSGARKRKRKKPKK